jgi:hypothetical protein
VITSTGFLAVNQTTGTTIEGYGVKQGSRTCNDAIVQGSFGFEATGVFVAGAPVTVPVAFIGELKLSVNASGERVISGHVAGSEDGTIFTFAEEPVTGSYSVATDCTGTTTITPKGKSALNFSFVVVDRGKEILAIETDADTVVSGTLVKGSDDNRDRDLDDDSGDREISLSGTWGGKVGLQMRTTQIQQLGAVPIREQL